MAALIGTATDPRALPDTQTEPGRRHIFCSRCHPTRLAPTVAEAICGSRAPQEGVPVLDVPPVPRDLICPRCLTTDGCGRCDNGPVWLPTG